MIIRDAAADSKARAVLTAAMEQCRREEAALDGLEHEARRGKLSDYYVRLRTLAEEADRRRAVGYVLPAVPLRPLAPVVAERERGLALAD